MHTWDDLYALITEYKIALRIEIYPGEDSMNIQLVNIDDSKLAGFDYESYWPFAQTGEHNTHDFDRLPDQLIPHILRQIRNV